MPVARLVILSLLPLLLGPPAIGAVCVGFSAPVDGPISEGFGPVGRFEGHWGIDFHVASGTEVVAAAPGVVAFSGEVVGVRSVTVDHGGGVRSTVSWLEEVGVRVGQAVEAGAPLGRFGGGHVGGLHFSVRIDGAYVDPEPLLGCVGDGYSDALSLVP